MVINGLREYKSRESYTENEDESKFEQHSPQKVRRNNYKSPEMELALHIPTTAIKPGWSEKRDKGIVTDEVR
jgi:hypothetical protein